jgi:hypothetical protein
MKEVVIHLGVHKTGTTSIQRTLFAARQTLAADGILYPDILRKGNHVDLYTCFHDAPLKYRAVEAKGITQPDELEKLQAEVRRSFEMQLASSVAERVILSSEAFSRMNADELRRFVSYVGSLGFGRMTFMVYLRDYITYWESSIQQQIKAGVYIDFAAEEQKLRSIRRYRPFLEALSACTEPANVKLRLFYKPLLRHGDVVADFLEQLDIDAVEPPSTYSNESLTKTAMIALNELNKRIPRAAASVGAERDNVAAVLKGAGGEKYRANATVAQRIIERTRKDRDYLAQHWFSGRDPLGEIMDEVAASPERASPDVDQLPRPEEILDAMGLLYANMQLKAAEQGAARWLATAHLARSRGQEQRAARAMQNYLVMQRRLRIARSGRNPDNSDDDDELDSACDA